MVCLLTFENLGLQGRLTSGDPFEDSGAVATPGHTQIGISTPSTSKVDYLQGNAPKVLGIGALARRYSAPLVPRNFFRRIFLHLKFPLMSWRGWLDKCRKKKSENCRYSQILS